MPRKIRIGFARNVRISGDSGAYATAGQGAGLYVGRKVAADQGAYATAGQVATLTYTPGQSQSGDFATRRSGANVIAWQGFDSDAEVTQFAGGFDTDLNAVPLYREADPIVGSAIVFKFIGAKLAANFLASGGNGPRTMVLDDASAWPTTFPFRFFVSKLPDTGPDKKTLFECSARSGNNLTVIYIPLGISEFDSGASFTDRFIGDAAGSECQNYIRPFSALTGADNGKGTNDPAASGTLPVRSRIVGNANYVPQTPSLFGYGYCAHPDYVNDTRFNPWVPNYQGTGLGDSTSRANIIDTSEVFIQYRLWLDHNTKLADMVGGKLFGLQTEETNPQQIVTGHGPGAGAFNIPSTNEVPFGIAKFNHTTYGSAGATAAANPYSPNGTSYQPGSFDPVTGKSWEATAIYAVSGQASVGQNTPDGSSAWEYKTGRWLTFQWRIKPGKNWHYSVPLKNSWDSATQSTLTLLDSPDEWPTSNFQIYIEYSSPASIFNVASRSGAVLSGLTLASGPHVTMAAQDGRWILTNPTTPAGAAALSTLLEVKFADFGDTQYKTLFSDNDHPMVFGSRGQYPHYFDTSIPGYSAAVLWGYHNSALSVANAPYKTLQQKFAQLIISKSEIPVPSGELPTWVPAAGAATTLTNANGKLTNHYRDAVDAWTDPFYATKSVNGYNGAFKNPYWGTYGATIFFGGGHSDSNHNGVIIAEYGQTAITYKRVCDSSPYYGNTFASSGLNGIGFIVQDGKASGKYLSTGIVHGNVYGESLVGDGAPNAPHSWGNGSVIGPEHGGATYGSFMQILRAAHTREEDLSVFAAHRLDFSTLATGNAARQWSRISNDSITTFAPASPPTHTCFVPAQMREYYVGRAPARPMIWYDYATATYVTGTGLNFSLNMASAPGGNGGGRVFHIPERNIMVCLYGWPTLTVEWMNVAGVSQPTMLSGGGGTVTLTTPINVEDFFSSACWCPHNNRIIVGGLTTQNAVAEIAIPDTLTDPWPSEVVPLVSGTLPFPLGGEASVADIYGKWDYDKRVRAIVFQRYAQVTGDDTVYVYRPRGT